MAAAAETKAPDDLATLSRLDNEILLENLRARYSEDEIYTYIGDILVAVNPFRPLHIYTPQAQSLYRGKQRSDEKPHIFAVADAAYHQLASSASSQCVIVSGESGAGKTESAKYVIRHITHLCRGKGSQSSDTLEHKILQLNPLLEAFGNAQTNLNDNSSRFGKYTELVFDRMGGVIGATISEYLLEKSRVVDQAPGEQAFHIMYYSFANPQRQELSLTEPAKFPYFSNPAKIDVESGQAFELFAEVMTALDDVGFTTGDSQVVFTVVAAVLHMSRIEFVSESADDALSPATLPPKSASAVDLVCRLLEMDPTVTAAALLEATNITRGETIVRKRDRQEALDTCDAMAKALYGRLFSWLVRYINVCLAADGKASESAKRIGILDIYGFESFDTNSFEQICINLANEYLQHFFNRHVFELELEEYQKEGVGDQISIEYADNRPLIDLFLRKPMGLFALLDEECTFPKATASSLVGKYKAYFKDSPYYLPTKAEGTHFQIKHYAGVVEYDAEFFLEKNRDLLAPAVVRALKASTFGMVAELFGGRSAHGAAARDAPLGRKVGRESRSPSADNTANKKADSLGHQYTTSLQVLIENMSQCRPHFVRCIKPNHDLRARDFRDDLVLAQLKYTGMLETTRIRRDGYAVRPTYAEFLERYRALAFSYRDVVHATAMNCKTVLEAAGVDMGVLGRSKVFMRHHQLDELEHKLKEFQKYATLIQRYARGWATRKVTKPLLRKARAQKAEVAAALGAFTKRCTTVAAVIKAVAKEDADRFAERREKMIAESRESATRLRLKRMQRAQQEEEKYQSARSDILAGVADAYSRQYHELFERLQTEQSRSVFDQLFALVSKRREALRSTVEKYESILAPLKSERESMKAAEDALAKERHALLPKIATGPAPGTPAFEALRTEALRIHERDSGLTIDVDRVRHSLSLCDGFIRDTRAAMGQTDSDLAAVLSVRLEHQENSAGTHAAGLEATKAELESLKVTYTGQLDSAEIEIESQRQAALKAQRENVRLSEAAEEATAELEAAKAELRAKIAAMKTQLADAVAAHESKADASAKAVRDLQSKLRSQTLEADNAVEDHAAEVAKLRAEVRSKTSAVAAVEAEREAILQELSTKVDAGQAAEASQLRVELTTEQAKCSDLEFKVGQLTEELRGQANLLALAKSEYEAIEADLRETVAEKERAAAIVLADTTAMYEGRVAASAAAAEDAARQTETQESAISELQSTIASLKAAHAQEVIGFDEAIVRTTAKLDVVTAKLKVEIEAKNASNLRAVELESSAQSATAKLESSQNKFELATAESQRTIATLQEAVAEGEAARNEMSARYDKHIGELSGQMELSKAEHDVAVSEFEAKLAAANEDLDERVATLKEQAAEYIEAVAKADARTAELEAQVELLQKANDKHVASTTTYDFKIEQLEAELAVFRAREEARSKVEEQAASRRQKTMAAIVEKEAEVSEKQRHAEAIRAMGRQNPGTMVQGDGKDVDLAVYVELLCGSMPPELHLSSYECKGYLDKISGKSKKAFHRWVVLDLKAKLLVWYVDDSEQKYSQKGSAEIQDIVSVQSDGRCTLFVQTKGTKNDITLQHDSPAVIEGWRTAFAAVARNRPHFPAKNGI
mmetsp:Transcript_1326/g.4349  ORF Transcript_1326/g.4349 Transcript_1326/m.4349 type:complete len:1619 (+) Transcript_1326:64-4920(+)